MSPPGPRSWLLWPRGPAIRSRTWWNEDVGRTQLVHPAAITGVVGWKITQLKYLQFISPGFKSRDGNIKVSEERLQVELDSTKVFVVGLIPGLKIPIFHEICSIPSTIRTRWNYNRKLSDLTPIGMIYSWTQKLLKKSKSSAECRVPTLPFNWQFRTEIKLLIIFL